MTFDAGVHHSAGTPPSSSSPSSPPSPPSSSSPSSSSSSSSLPTAPTCSTRIRNTDTDCDLYAECCGLLCSIIGLLVCCRKTTNTKRILGVWAWMIIIAVSLACLMHFVVFTRQSYDTSPTDVRTVTRPGFAILCLAAVFESSQDFQVTSIPDYPHIDSSGSGFIHYEVNVSRRIAYNGFVYWRFYLLRGSIIQVSACGKDSNLHQYLLKGKGSLQEWLRDGSGKCYSQAYIHTCNDLETFPLTYTIHETDAYYFYYTPTRSSTKVEVNFQLNRTNYDYTKGVVNFQCSLHVPCSVTVPLNVKQTLVYRGKDTKHFGTALTVDCDIRLMMYFVFFGLTPFVTGIVISIIISEKCKDNSQESSSPHQSEDGQHSRSNRGTQGQRSNQGLATQGQRPRNPFRDLPPSYEELVNEPPPPAYPGIVNHL